MSFKPSLQLSSGTRSPESGKGFRTENYFGRCAHGVFSPLVCQPMSKRGQFAANTVWARITKKNPQFGLGNTLKMSSEGRIFILA
jgi:hypothetical protein